MRLECLCGRTYRTPDHDCPGCGATLKPLPSDAPRRPVPPGAAGIDPDVLVRQKLALRDELRIRDRQLRQAGGRLRALQAEIDRLKAGSGTAVHIAQAPVRVFDAPLPAMELPSDRPDISNLPLIEEVPALQNATLLPDDRLPLFDGED